MKEKIFNKLKQTYSKFGLGDEILLAHASNLANLGFVTDENLDTVIAAQNDFLEGLQKSNDKRVNDAVEKAKKKVKDDYEEETKKKEEEAKKKAEEEARKKAEEEARIKAEKEAEEKRKAEEEAERKRKEEMEKNKEIPDSIKKLLEERDAQAKAERTAFEERLKSMDEAYKKSLADHEAFVKSTEEKTTSLLNSYNTMKKEAEDAKAEMAKRQRADFIMNTAKELGIPQYRIDEGFNIGEDADENAIKDYLGKVSNNIKVNNLPAGGHHLKTDDKTPPSKEEVDEVAKLLVR